MVGCYYKYEDFERYISNCKAEIARVEVEIDATIHELEYLRKERDEWAASVYYLKKDNYKPRTAEEIDDFENAKAELEYYTDAAAEIYHDLANLRNVLIMYKSDLRRYKKEYREYKKAVA